MSSRTSKERCKKDSSAVVICAAMPMRWRIAIVVLLTLTSIARGQPTIGGTNRIQPSARLPTEIRRLSPAEIEKAKTVFDESLDYDHIVVTDGLGTDGRAFVMLNPIQVVAHWIGGIDLPRCAAIQIVNWGPKPSSGVFFHELTHVWQSQHHRDPEAFMINSLVSSVAATILNKHAYAFIPGQPFASYGAEQMAQQVQRNRAAIIEHLRSIPENAIDPENIPYPWWPKVESLDRAGVEL